MTFYEFLKQFHSGWAYLVVLMGIVFTVGTAIYAFKGKASDKTIKRLGFLTTLIFFVQLIIGFLLYFFGPFSKFSGETMKDSFLRLFSVEHPLMMVAAVVFVMLANARLGRSETVTKSVFVYSLIALICLLSRIPWAIWLG